MFLWFWDVAEQVFMRVLVDLHSDGRLWWFFRALLPIVTLLIHDREHVGNFLNLHASIHVRVWAC
jgi:hypothetical protein